MVFCCRSFYQLGSMNQKLTVFRQKKFGIFIETAFYILPTKVWRKNCISIKTISFIFLGFSAENFLVMDENFSVALLELHSTCLANVSIKLDILKFLSQLSGFERKEVWLVVIISGVIVRTTLYVYWKIFQVVWFFGRKFFWNLM